MKKIFLLLSAFSLVLTIFTQNEVQASGSSTIKVVLDGKTIAFPTIKPYVNRENKVMIPVRFIGDYLQYKIVGNAAKKEVTISDKSNKIIVKIGSKMIKVNGKQVTMDAKVETVKTSTYVPLTFISTALGKDVQYNNKTKVVTISTKKKPPVVPAPPKQNEQPVTIYTVVSGDSLSKISVKFSVTIDQLKQWNGLKNDMILVGQKLKVSNGMIPNPSIPTFLSDAIFPLKKGTYTPFSDTWGAARIGGKTHEGTDIMAPIGTPIYSATDGIINNIGWNYLGGWRISIKTAEGYNLYYAHMSKYATGMKLGISVKKGQLIGYVGNTGQGPEGTSGQFVSHLHFGMYDVNWVAINPYKHLKYWESK